GSIEAILDVLETYHSEEVPLDVLSYGVGEVTPNDVEMAKAFKGSIYTFNVPVSKEMRQLARKSGVPLEENNIIYRLVDKLKEEISKRLPLKPVEEIIGEANVQQEFLVSEGKKKVPVAGCLCVKGQLKKNASFRVLRSQNVIHEGPIESLRHVKKEVDSIKKDVECGIRLQDVDVRFQPGDQLVCFRVNMSQQQTDWSPDGF
ncbi:UNVERIFIED_CONTAM: hypothetical protein GTU68_051782, partial [Idotea baltica]|nr:hypothetical protein [Idotea baltica]